MSESAPKSLNPPHPQRILYWLIRGVFLESIRRRELYVVLLFMGLFLIGALITRITGAESEAAASFILNLGLSMAWILSLIVSLLMASRQFPDELEQRSIYPLLAKPVSRNQYLLGKWIASWLTGSASAFLLNLLVLISASWPKNVSFVLLIQALTLEIFAVGLITSLAIAFSIRLPKALTIVVVALLAFAVGPLLNSLRSRTTSFHDAITWISFYIPDFSRLDLINALSAGSSALNFSDFGARLLTSLIFIVLALATAMVLLEKKPL